MDNLAIEILVFGLLILGAVLHGVTGLGFPIVSTMSVAIIYPLPVAIALIAFPNIIINFIVLLPSKNNDEEVGLFFAVRKFWLLVLSTVIGCIIGVLLLKELPLGWLYLLLSLATLFYVFYTFFNAQKTVKQHGEWQNSTLKMLVFGGLAGVVGGATNAMSSILMMYLLAASNNKSEIVKVSNFCFLLAKIVQIALLKDELSNLGTSALWVLPLITVVSVAALFIGIKIRDKISIALFKKFVLIMLLLLSLRAGWSALLLI